MPGCILPMAAENLSVFLSKQSSNIIPFFGELAMCQMVAKVEEVSSRIPLQFPPPSLLYTNTSQTGWGTHLQDLTTSLTFDSTGEGTSYQCLWNEGSSISPRHLPALNHEWRSTVVVYLKKQGGTVFVDMWRLAQEIIAWSELHIVTILASYIPGKKNLTTDQLSCPNHVLPQSGPFFFKRLTALHGVQLPFGQSAWNKGSCEPPHLYVSCSKAYGVKG